MIRVLIVDDSPLIRALLSELLNQAADIEVVAAASDPFEARELIKRYNPDVLTLDIEMPKMNGIQFLKNLMRLRPMPVIMISTLTKQGAPVTLEALELGAVDFVSKPVNQVVEKLSEYADTLRAKVRTAARARVRAYKTQISASAVPVNYEFRRDFVVALGASTGGTEAIKEILVRLPENFPAIVVTQHIPPIFSTSFALRMDKSCAMKVKEAEQGDVLKPGHVYIAPGDAHLSIIKSGGSLVCQLDQSEPVNRHRPSVDVLFNSLSQHSGPKTLAVLLTGMGADGAKGLLNLKQAGARTLVQDEASSVVWGMPKAALDIGAAEQQQALHKLPDTLISMLRGGT